MTAPKRKPRRKAQPSTATAILAVVESVVAAYKLVKPFIRRSKKAKAKKAATKKEKS